MNIKKPLTWLPQSLSILVTLLLFTFLFEFTPEGFKWSHFMFALIPGLVALLFAVLAWFLPKPGGIVYVVAGVTYAALMWGKVTVTAILVLAGVLVVTGVLYLLQTGKKGKLEEKTLAPQQAPFDKRKTEEKLKDFQKTTMPPTGKTDASTEKLTKGETTKLPPLPPLPQKTDQPKVIEEVKADYKEPNFFGDATVTPTKETKEVESQLLEPQPPKAKVELPPPSDVSKESVKKEIDTVQEVPKPPAGTQAAAAVNMPLEKVIEPTAPTPKESVEEVPIEKKVEITEPFPSPIEEEKAEEPTPVPELSILEYPDEGKDETTKEKGKPGVEKEETPDFQSPAELWKKTVAPWKVAAPDANAVIQTKNDDASMTPDLPQVSLTNKGPALSGDTLTKSEVPSTPAEPTQEGVNADFIQWAKKEGT